MQTLRRNVIPLSLATLCGTYTAYSAFQPELQKNQDERLGHVRTTAAQPQVADNAISRAIAEDFREAAQELKVISSKKGPAWAIREALFGTEESKTVEQATAKTSDATGSR